MLIKIRTWLRNQFYLWKVQSSPIKTKYRIDRGYLSHFLFEDFCIFCVWFLGRLWYAKISSELLATIEQYQISLKRNTMVANEQFIRRRHLWQPAPVTG